MNRQLYFISLCFFLTLSAVSAGASDRDRLWFEKNFELRRDAQNHLQEVRIRKQTAVEINENIQIVLNEQKKYQSKGVMKFDENLLPFEGIEGLEEWTQLKSNFWNDLVAFPLKEETQKKNFQDTLVELQRILLDGYPGAAILARPDDSTFFFRYKMERVLFNLAREAIFSRLADSVGAGIATYFFEKALDQIESRRAYYQNMFLQLLATNPDLGLSSEEIQLVTSSIIESRLSWYDFGLREDAKKDWVGFGSRELLNEKEKARSRWSKHMFEYDQSQMLNFGFSESIKGNHRWIHNQINKKSPFSSQPSLSFDSSDPTKVMDTRQLYEFISFGISVLPVISIISPLASYTLKKMYVGQIKNEGSLYMYFWQNGQREMAHRIVLQSMNSFLIREL